MRKEVKGVRLIDLVLDHLGLQRGVSQLVPQAISGVLSAILSELPSL
jgi:hypothetical protein